MEKLVLIDGNSILYRAFYATPYFATSKGVQTNAVYGFLNMLLKITTDIAPTHMLVAFDRKEPTYRHKMYDGYKATRKPMPEELVPQVDLIKRTLNELKIKTFEQAGLEADDIIGSAAKFFNVETIIITGDKDSFQLVDESTSVYFTRKGISDHDVYSLANFKEKTGIYPIQIIDLKACMGDSSDNIPGISGIGEKTAKSLIEQYGCIENLYEHTNELKGKLKEKVESGKDMAFLSKQLATIDVNADLNLTLNDLKFEFPFPQSARKLFSELEFNSLLKKNIFAENEQISLPDEQIEKNQKTQIKREIINEITRDKMIIESKDYTLVFDKNVYVYSSGIEFELIIKDNFFDPGISFDNALLYLSDLFLKGNHKVIIYDKKKVRYLLNQFGFDLHCDCEDVALLKYVVDYTQKELSLNELIERADCDLKSPAYSLNCIYEKYLLELNAQKCEKVYREIELPLCDVLYDMEKAGFKVDGEALDAASEKYHRRNEQLYAQITELVGCTFNLNSPKQLGEILFDKLGLKHGKKTKNGYSTNADVLEELEDAHPVIPLILKYRQQQKLLSTYVDGFRPLIDKKTRLIHTVFNQAVTSTGRLSSKEPNLQNIPVREEEGRELRKFFIARSESRVLVGADYSQIELRLLAHFSGCEPLIDAFNDNVDVHSLTASQVFGVEVDKVTDEQRRSAKAVNFGIIYGISDFGLAKNLKISPKVAGEYIKKYFEMYPSVREYMLNNVEFARNNGYAVTYFGRRRIIPEIKSPNYVIRSFGERAAMNMPLQGTAADIIKVAMINVYNRLKKEVPDAKLILQVHDELIVDTEQQSEQLVCSILTEEMQNAVKLSVPLTVNVASGKTWFEAK